jgi:hypothetical protein
MDGDTKIICETIRIRFGIDTIQPEQLCVYIQALEDRFQTYSFACGIVKYFMPPNTRLPVSHIFDRVYNLRNVKTVFIDGIPYSPEIFDKDYLYLYLTIYNKIELDVLDPTQPIEFAGMLQINFPTFECKFAENFKYENGVMKPYPTKFR